MNKTVLITGASSGIGLATANAMRDAGYTVIGTSRKPDKAQMADGITYLPLDLMDEHSIKQLAEELPPIDVLVCNAGVSQMGAVEDVPMDKIRQLYELLYFGNVQLIQRVLPNMRKRRSGTIIIVSSLAELSPVPCSAVYASAKAAMHTLATGLRHEVHALGIEVTTVAPTFVRTPIVQERLVNDDSAYANIVKNAGAVRDNGIRTGSTPEAIGQRIAAIAGKGKIKSFYAIGKNARLLQMAYKWLPERIKEAMIRRHFKLSKRGNTQ